MNVVNFVSQHTYDFEHKVWARAAQENLGMVAMKVFGGDTQTKDYRITDEYYDLAMRYAYSLPGLSNAVVGMKSVAELEKAVAAVLMVSPLSAEERYELAKKGLDLAQTDRWRAPHGEPLT
jgi:aryl-alcohol dehydrogenase-like predicted oxidoreductase